MAKQLNRRRRKKYKPKKIRLTHFLDLKNGNNDRQTVAYN